jgi:hypothetical protein
VHRMRMDSLIHELDGKARPQAADAGDSLQIWRIPANVFNSTNV